VKTLLRHKTMIAMLVSLIALVVILIIPFNLVMTPERRLVFVDDSGKPIAYADVRQAWQQYSLGVSGEDRLKTDADGAVHLPKHSINTSIIWLIVGALREIRSVGIHAGFGSSEYIMIRIDGQTVKSYYDGKGLENKRVVIKRS
jgi:hypothetical protein